MRSVEGLSWTIAPSGAHKKTRGSKGAAARIRANYTDIFSGHDLVSHTAVDVGEPEVAA